MIFTFTGSLLHTGSLFSPLCNKRHLCLTCHTHELHLQVLVWRDKCHQMSKTVESSITSERSKINESAASYEPLCSQHALFQYKTLGRSCCFHIKSTIGFVTGGGEQ